jgi:hypothetical protein
MFCALHTMCLRERLMETESAIRNMRSVAVCDPSAFVVTERAGGRCR